MKDKYVIQEELC